MIRNDLSNKLIHLTKGGWDDALHTFQQIIEEKGLKGSPGGIKSRDNCICFSEAPLSALSHILANTNATNFRYAPFGFMVSKEWLFSKGGRPVIYQPSQEYDFLPEKLKYRHQILNIESGKDYTWEREWRLKTDLLILDSSETTLIVPNRSWEEKILDNDYQRIQRRSAIGMFGVGMPKNSIKNSWHFIVLEDLGVPIPTE